MTGWSPSKIEVIGFLNAHELCVLSTLGADNEPQGATVAFSENDKLELMVGTSLDSRKYANMVSRPRVAVTITDVEKRLTVQYQGVAHLLNPLELTERESAHYTKLPASLPFKNLPDQAFFVIYPIQVRFSDCNPTPWLVTSFTF
jgi:hypothetical protein